MSLDTLYDETAENAIIRLGEIGSNFSSPQSYDQPDVVQEAVRTVLVNSTFISKLRNSVDTISEIGVIKYVLRISQEEKGKIKYTPPAATRSP